LGVGEFPAPGGLGIHALDLGSLSYVLHGHPLYPFIRAYFSLVFDISLLISPHTVSHLLTSTSRILKSKSKVMLLDTVYHMYLLIFSLCCSIIY